MYCYVSRTIQLSAQFIFYTQFNVSKVSKIGDVSREWPEGSLFKSYYTEV